MIAVHPVGHPIGVNVDERPKGIHSIDLIKGIQESGLLIDG